MNKKRFFIGVGVSLAIVVMIMLSVGGPEKVSAMDCRLIKITSRGLEGMSQLHQRPWWYPAGIVYFGQI